MIKKSLAVIIIFYLLVLIQTSFLSQFDILGLSPNYVLLLVIFINIFERQEGKLGLISALTGGILMDIFTFSSGYFFGFNFLIFMLVYILIKFIFRNYVQVPIIKKI